MILMNDATQAIKEDKDFGANVAAAMTQIVRGTPVDVSAGNHVNAATVIETHHADTTALVSFGQNTGMCLGQFWLCGDESHEIKVARALANSLGYTLHKKPKRK